MMLKDKKAVITGGTSGIGKAIAETFAREGADIVIFGIDIDKAAEAIADIEKCRANDSQQVLFENVDVSNFSVVEEATNKIIAAWGRIDIFVNNAGITRDNLLMKMSEEDWDRVLSVNLKSVFNTCHALIRPMMRAKFGKIINIASVIGLIGNAGQVNYAASKAGVIGLTKSLAKEAATRNICVNAIAPGYIRTQMTDRVAESAKEAILATIPMQRMGSPEDVAKLALFLASSMSDYITGQVIAVDGGMVM